MKKIKYLIGIDEVGRGCLAGPVTVTALAIPAGFKVGSFPLMGGFASSGKVPLRDSKKLSAEQREKWAKCVRNHPGIIYETSYVYPNAIGKINISGAANLAATRAVARLISGIKYPASSIKILLDGGLYLNPVFNTKYRIVNTQTVVKGDEKFNCIKLASIVAKVSRDRAMRRLHRKYPAYGLDEHKGYGTKAHIAAIKKYGPSSIHRLTFISNFV